MKITEMNLTRKDVLNILRKRSCDKYIGHDCFKQDCDTCPYIRKKDAINNNNLTGNTIPIPPIQR